LDKSPSCSAPGKFIRQLWFIMPQSQWKHKFFVKQDRTGPVRKLAEILLCSTVIGIEIKLKLGFAWLYWALLGFAWRCLIGS
jgi:hypothetical protein